MFIWSTEPDINYNLDWEKIDKHGNNGTHSKADAIKGWLNSQSFLAYAGPLFGEGTKKGRQA